MRAVQFQGRHFAPASALRQRQVDELTRERKMCEEKLNMSRFDRTINTKHWNQRLNSVTAMLNNQQAKPFETNELNDAIKEEREIRSQLIESCQSNRVLRHAPAGAVPQLIRWEAENKNKLLYWKGLRLRLHASGIDLGTTPEDVANFEPYRPRETAWDQNMDNSVVPVKTFHTVPEMPKPENTPTLEVSQEVPEEGSVDVSSIVLAKPFFSLKKQVKELTGTAPKDTAEAKALLVEAGITYEE